MPGAAEACSFPFDTTAPERSVSGSSADRHPLFYVDPLDAHYATVFFLRTNSSFIPIVYRMSPTCNRTVLISMHGVVICVCTIQRKAKICAMPGKMSKRCSTVATGNDRLRERTSIIQAVNYPPSRMITSKTKTT